MSTRSDATVKTPQGIAVRTGLKAGSDDWTLKKPVTANG
jgi:hypothetical protein